jgi:hypothetical protein
LVHFIATPVHRSLFETIKAACVAAGGEEVEEAEKEVIKGIVAAPETAGPVSLASHSAILFACFAFLIVLFLLWRVLFRQSASAVVVSPPSQDLLHLGRRIDDLEVEIKAVQTTLNEVLTLLKSQQQQFANE